MIITRSRTSVITSSGIKLSEDIDKIEGARPVPQGPNPLSYDQFTRRPGGHTVSSVQNQLKSKTFARFRLYLVRTHANFSADYFNATAILGSARLRPAAALRHGSRGRHIAHGHLPARHRARTLERRLRAALTSAHRRPLWRQPQPLAALLPVPSRAEARPLQYYRPVPGLVEAPGHQSGRARHPFC